MKTTDVFPGSSTLVDGTPPTGSLLLIGQAGIGKTTFCKQFIQRGLTAGEPCIYIAIDEPPQEIQKSMKRFGATNEATTNKSNFHIIDCYSWKVGANSSSDNVVTNPADLTNVWRATEKAIHNVKNINLVFDSITGLTSICKHSVEEVSKFFQVMVAKIRTVDGRAIFTISPEAYDIQFMSLLRQAFDGTLEMKEDETGNEIKRLLRVFSLKEAKHKTSWAPFEITDHGIELHRSGDELRCTMCSRLIEWNPYVDNSAGKQLLFDTEACANTYKKFKSIYGASFE